MCLQKDAKDLGNRSLTVPLVVDDIEEENTWLIFKYFSINLLIMDRTKQMEIIHEGSEGHTCHIFPC